MTTSTGEVTQQERRGLAAVAENFRHVWANRNVRRIQLAFVGSETGDWAYGMAMMVWAYGVGGATLVGVWAGIRMLLAAVAATFGGALADRMSRRTFMMANDGIRLVLTAITAAAILLDAGVWAVLVPATLTTLVGSSFRAAQAGLLPSLVDSPRQLTAANATAEITDSTASFAGPALAGLLLGLVGIVPVVLLNAATFAWSLLMVAGVRPRPASPAAATGVRPAGEAPGDGEDAGETFLAEVLGGFRAILVDKDMVATVGILCVNGALGGALSVLVVIIAAESLGDPAAVGWISAILGATAFLGGIVMLGLAGRLKLGRVMLLGILGWCIPLVVMGLLPNVVVIVIAVAVIGLLDPMVNVGFVTVPPRLVPERVLSRVFAAIESLFIATGALGAFVTPLLVTRFGVGPGIVIMGVAGIVVALLCAVRVPHLDARLSAPRGLELLATVPLFRPLSPTMLEQVAHKLEPVEVGAGEVVIAEGDSSDRFYVIESGTVSVAQSGRELRREGPGEVFGEIGLLRDVPRTASVTAVGPVVLLSLTREDFLALMAGEDGIAGPANELVASRMAV